MMECDDLPSAVKARVRGIAKRKNGQRYGHITYQDHYSYAGESYPIRAKPSGCYTDILRSIIERMLAMRSLYGRVLLVVFELHHPQFGEKNEMVSAFIKSARAHVQNRYQTPDLGFVWVREQERTKGQHYHLILMVDGDKVRNSLGANGLSNALKEIWQRKGGTIHHSGYHFIDDDQSFNKAFEHASYLAKARGKGYRADWVRDIGASQTATPF
jgi:hypothetical protein